MLSDRIRAMGAPHWLALFGLILGAWVMLYAMALPDDLRASARIFGAEFWDSLCTVTPDAAGFGRVVLMWALMAAAMMAPTALPAFATYDDLGRSTQTRFGALVAGYMIVWLGFSVLAGGLQMGLYGLGLISAFGDSLSVWLSAGLLLVAGLYQFSPVKEACLSKCRAPLTFFMAHWDEGPLRNGLRLGLVCLGCCWALMLLAFVGGVMNIAFMGLATLIMVIEKLPQFGRVLTRPLGVVLIIAGFFVALGAV
jgi:predicted metal-binding membrane protein